MSAAASLPPRETLEALLDRVPGLESEVRESGEFALLSAGRLVAVARADADLVVEMPISAGLRESLEAAGLATVLPRGRRATWRIPPDDLEEAVAVLRAARAAV